MGRGQENISCPVGDSSSHLGTLNMTAQNFEVKLLKKKGKKKKKKKKLWKRVAAALTEAWKGFSETPGCWNGKSVSAAWSD